MLPGGALGRWTLASATALVAVLAAACPAAASHEDFFGVNAQGVFNLPSSSWDAHLAAMSRGGLQLVRRDASWGSAEPSAPDPSTGAHRYVWSSFDDKVAAYARHGLRWLPIVDYSAGWAASIPGVAFSPPAHDSDYASYAAALARRYGRGGSFWSAHPELPQLPVTRYEIWNEENTAYFWKSQDTAPERYADLYLAARSAIKAVDPFARVIVGGLALANTGVTSEADFVRRMYAHRPDLKGNVDAVGFHPYTPTVDGVYTKIRDFRDTLRSVGAGNPPLEITEVGWTTLSTSDAQRASMLARLASDLPRSDCGIASLIPHTWVTKESDPSNPEDWFGIANADASLKPSGKAYLDAIGEARGSSGGDGTVKICGGGGSTDPGNPSSSGRGSRGGSHHLGGPRVRLRVRRHRWHRRWIVATLRCPTGCRARLELLPVSRASRRGGRPLARRSLRFSSRRRRIVLRPRGSRRVLELCVTARGRTGGVTTRVRMLRLHRG
jgi:hypothetical protein